MEVKSTPHLVHRSAAELHARLIDLSRLGSSLPPQVTRYQVNGDTCSFTIQGMADISLYISRKDPDHVTYSSLSDKPFPFHLHFWLSEEDEQTCALTVVFEGDLNPMLAMMARGPLQNFVNLLAQKLSENRF
ncbi:MAG: hypothetical protein ACP5O2_06100 [Bacteroidales bacterium]